MSHRTLNLQHHLPGSKKQINGRAFGNKLSKERLIRSQPLFTDGYNNPFIGRQRITQPLIFLFRLIGTKGKTSQRRIAGKLFRQRISFSGISYLEQCNRLLFVCMQGENMILVVQNCYCR